MKKKIEEIIHSFSQKTILVIGDVMIDSYMWGNVERISPEAPVPVISIANKENRLGGAANVALNIASLGAQCILCGIIGNDEYGQWFTSICEEQQINASGIFTDPNRPTTVKTRIIAGNQHLLRVDEEMSFPINDEIQDRFFQKIKQTISQNSVDAIVFEDYDKGAITPLIIEWVLDLAQSKKIPVTIDPKKRNFNNYAPVTLFKPNFKELCEGLNVSLSKNNPEHIHEVLKPLHDKGIENIMVTLSEKGIYIGNKDQFFVLPARVRDVADVSGAGDTVISVATLCIALQLPLFDIAAISNISGGLVCEKVGVVPIDKDELITSCKVFYNEVS